MSDRVHLLPSASDQPIQAAWRFVFSAVFSGLAIWWYVYSELPAGEGFLGERWAKSITVGVTFGVLYGLVVVLGSEVPARLRRNWPQWARLLLSILGTLILGTLMWAISIIFFFNIIPFLEQFYHPFIGGLALSASLALMTPLRISPWLKILWTAAAIYISLYVTWWNWENLHTEYPLIFPRLAENIYRYALVIGLFFAVGAYAHQVLLDGLSRFRRTSR